MSEELQHVEQEVPDSQENQTEVSVEMASAEETVQAGSNEALPEASENPEVPPDAATEDQAIADPERVAESNPADQEATDARKEEKKAADAKSENAKAAKAKKQAEDTAFPFSVTVGKVYDGPLDLLLDLIRKQDIDIYDIPIAKITAQFLAYIEGLKQTDVDAAGEFIYMASLLIHIKSKMLLPRSPVETAEGEVEDPRRELVERLLEHERFKNAAQMLQQKQMLEASSWSNPGIREFRHDAAAEPEIAADTLDLVRIFREILERAKRRPILDVEEESVTVGQMIRFLSRRMTMEDRPVALKKLLSNMRSERALICMFLAILELVRLQAVMLRQDQNFSEIFVKKNVEFDRVMNDDIGQAHDDWR